MIDEDEDEGILAWLILYTFLASHEKSHEKELFIKHCDVLEANSDLDLNVVRYLAYVHTYILQLDDCPIVLKVVLLDLRRDYSNTTSLHAGMYQVKPTIYELLYKLLRAMRVVNCGMYANLRRLHRSILTEHHHKQCIVYALHHRRVCV